MCERRKIVIDICALDAYYSVIETNNKQTKEVRRMNATVEKTVLTDEQRTETDRVLTAFELIPADAREKAIYFLEGMAAAASAAITPKVS